VNARKEQKKAENAEEEEEEEGKHGTGASLALEVTVIDAIIMLDGGGSTEGK
jgi:hypothetical protein